MKQVLNLLFILIITGCQSEFPQDFESINKRLKNEYSSKTAGIGLSVVSDNSTIWSGAYGMANIALNKPMTTDHIINIASVSKLFVATAIMQLSERSLLSIDDNINRHLPFDISYPKNENLPITIRQLLTHKSSILDGQYYDESYTTDPHYKPLSEWLKNYLHIEGDAYSSNNFIDKDPGQQWTYSNIGFGVLALIVENVSGIKFDEYCQQYIFSPLEMKSTTWKEPLVKDRSATLYAFFSEEPHDDELSKIYKLLESKSIDLRKYLPIKSYRFPNYPDGLLYSTVNDLSRYAQCILNGGKFKNHKILDPNSIDSMFELQGKDEKKQGLCWRYTGFENIWGHGGDDPGVQSGLYIDRVKNRAMIMMKNSNLGSRTQVVKGMYKASLSLE